GVTPPADADPSCVALAVRSLAGRSLVARWVESSDASPSVAYVPRWYLTAAFVLADTRQRGAALRAQVATLATGVVNDPTDALLGVTPLLALEGPRARALAASVAAQFPQSTRVLGPARLRARDPAVVTESLTLLSITRIDVALRLLITGLGASEGAVTTTRAALVSLREQSRAVLLSRIDPREVDAWLEALIAVSACHAARACLAGLVAHGSETAAARAVYALGARGLESLDDATADALVRRLSTIASVPLLSAFALTVRGCPTRLRGAVEARTVADERLLAIRPFFSWFAAACGAR
ncbi:MAG: hypothetical protein WCJ30_24160, partial [Deltaproteobacteria bacterium]